MYATIYKNIYLMVVYRLSCLDVWCVVALLTVWSVRGECIFRVLSRVAHVKYIYMIFNLTAAQTGTPNAPKRRNYMIKQPPIDWVK